jgi:hypothetical protein
LFVPLHGHKYALILLKHIKADLSGLEWIPLSLKGLAWFLRGAHRRRNRRFRCKNHDKRALRNDSPEIQGDVAFWKMALQGYSMLEKHLFEFYSFK